MKNTSEQLLSFAENELIDKEAIRRAVLKSVPDKQKTPVAWTKLLLPIAACLVLLCGTVFAIPSARAEVLSWFRSMNPATDYLTAPEHTQTPVDGLIATAKPQQAHGVLQVADESVWQRIAADFSAAPREAFFDGNRLNLSVTLRGLSALPSLDSLTGGSATASGDDVPVYIYLVLKDGTELSCGPVTGLDRYPGIAAYFDSLTGKSPDEISQSNIEFLKDRELTGVARCEVRNPNTGKGFGTVAFRDGREIEIPDVWALLSDNAGETGILTASVRYRTAIDTEQGLATLLEADLGTIEVDLYAHERLDRRTLQPEQAEIIWRGTTVLSEEQRTAAADGGRSVVTITNTEVRLEGLTFRIGNGRIDALGIGDLSMVVTLPEGWTQAERETFFRSLSFRTRIGGELLSGGTFTCEADENGAFRLTYRNEQIPYELLNGVETIELVPVLMYRTTVRTADGEYPIPLNQPVEGRMWEGEEVEWTEFAITLNVR